MTTIQRRTKSMSRYIVVRCWDAEGQQHTWSVIDRTRMTWARGTSDTGYTTEEEAAAHCDALRAKEKQ